MVLLKSLVAFKLDTKHYVSIVDWLDDRCYRSIHNPPLGRNRLDKE